MATQKQLIETLVLELASIKSKLPNGELKMIQKSLVDLEKGQADIKKDVKTLQKRLFNPDDGLIVENNKMQSFIKGHNNSMPMYNKIIDDFKGVKNWKKSVQRGLWVIYSAVIGIIIKLLFWN